MFVPAAMTPTQMTSTGVLVGSVAGAVIVLLAVVAVAVVIVCLLYTSPSPRDYTRSRMPSSA